MRKKTQLADLEGSRAWQKRQVLEHIPAAIQTFRTRNYLSDADPVAINAPRFVLDALVGVDGLGRIEPVCHGGEMGIYLYDPGSFVHGDDGMLDLGYALGLRGWLRIMLGQWRPRRFYI